MKTLDGAVELAKRRAVTERRNLSVYLLADGTFLVRDPIQFQRWCIPAKFAGLLRVADIHHGVVEYLI